MGTPPLIELDENGLTPYERERAEKIARNAAQMKALGLPALGGIVGAAPSSAGGFTPVRRKNPIATPEPAAPFRIILRERPAKPVNYNVDAFDSEDEEEARERKRARRAETARAGGKPRKRPAAAKDDNDCSDYEVESGDEDDDDALGSASDSDSDSDDEVDPDPPSEEFLLYDGSLAKKYEVPEHRARANRTAAMYTNGTNWLEESKLNFRACRDRAKERRLAKEQAAREKQERKLQRRKEKDEGAGAMVVVPGDAPETDDVDANGKKIRRIGFRTVQGAEGKTRGRGGKNGVTTCAKCPTTESSQWFLNKDPAIPGEKICKACYNRAQVGDGYVCPGCKSTVSSDWSNAKGHLVCHDEQLVQKGVKICQKCNAKEPPFMDAQCVKCEDKAPTKWLKSKHQMNDATGEPHYMCGKCYRAEPERLGDACADATCGKVDPLEWRRSKIKKREGEPDAPAPLCYTCWQKEARALKKKD